MAREDFHLYKQKRSDWWTARKRHQGRSHTICTETADKRIARARARKWVDDLIAQAWGENPPRSFKEAADKFRKEHYAELKLKTALRYDASMAHLLEHFEKLTLDKITGPLLYEFEQARRRAGVKPGTIVNDFRCLSALLNLAQLWEWTDKNPVQAYLERRKRALKAAEARQRYLSHDEEGALLNEASERWRWMIVLAIETGLRREEQFSLLKSDVNWQRNFIQVRKEVAKSSSRQVPLTERGAEALRELFKLNTRSLYVCARENGDRFSPTSPSILDQLKKYCRHTGIENFRWHDLRRTYGCRCLQDRRMPLEHVSKCMGHSSVKVTEKVYAFLKIDNLNRMMAETEGRVVPIKGKGEINVVGD